MYPGHHATDHPDRPAIVMASSGTTISYRVFEERANRLAHLFTNHGLLRADHIAIFMENHERYIEVCAAAQRSGLYFTCVNSYLTPDEVAYIVDNSESQVLVTSAAKQAVAFEAAANCPRLTLVLVVDGLEWDGTEIGNAVVRDFATVVEPLPSTPIENERYGLPMLYSSGTTGRPKGIVSPLPDVSPLDGVNRSTFLRDLWSFREGMVYLSPAPLYHSAPIHSISETIDVGGTAVIMERFDPLDYLRLVEEYSVTHSQLVPTMFSRMLKLTDDERHRYDLSSLEIAIHAAAPCPPEVKEQMIEWWGPIIFEYFGATEGLGFAACTSEEWLAQRGTVGRIIRGELHILDDDMNELPVGEPGQIWFRNPSHQFAYHNDPAKTAESTSDDGSMTSVGDMGYINEDGFLFLTDRKTFMIISGGVNIYPQETENVLITHPDVADVAVFGVPNPDLGEEVKAVVQLADGVEPSDQTTATLLAFCRERLSKQKVPRTIDYEDELPRLPTGKLYKKKLRARYWEGHATSI